MADKTKPEEKPADTTAEEEPKKYEPVEEDDEFEEFEGAEWDGNAEDHYDIKQWEEDWDDDDEEDTFAQKLRQELAAH